MQELTQGQKAAWAEAAVRHAMALSMPPGVPGAWADPGPASDRGTLTLDFLDGSKRRFPNITLAGSERIYDRYRNDVKSAIYITDPPGAKP